MVINNCKCAMFHFQVVSMGTRLLLFVICQTVITESLGGVTLPFSDLVGKVTPVKPKLLSPSAVSSSVTKSSLVCDGKDILPKLFSPAPGIQAFSSPLAFTSSSRALPVPKIDSISIADVKMPEKLREKFLLTKLRNAPVSNAKKETVTPNVSLPHKYPFLSPSTKPSNAFPAYSLWDMSSSSSSSTLSESSALCSSSLNKISSLSNIKSLPIVPVKPLKSIGTDVPCSASKNNNVLALPSITPLSRCRTLDTPLTLEARKAFFSEQLNSITFSPLSSCSSPYQLYYKSMFLPGVRTPSEMLPLSCRPISYKATDNIDFPSQSGSCNLLSPKTLTSDNSRNSLAGRNGPYSTYVNPIKTAEIPKPTNTKQLPKTPSNVPAQTAAAKNLWPSLDANSGSAFVAFESALDPEFLSSAGLKYCADTKMPRSSIPYLMADKIPDFKLKPCTPLKIKPYFLNCPASSLAPISQSSPIVDRLSSIDYSKNINTPHMFPIIGACVETIENFNTNRPSSSSTCQTCVDSKDVPSLERINLSSSFEPKLTSYHHPIFTEECVISPLKYSPPVIPLEPITAISSRSSAFSPITYFPSQISQNPSSTSYINQSPPSSIAQSTANMVSSINDLVSKIAQNILSSYKSYIDSALPNVSQRPTYTIQSNPSDTTEFIPKQILPVLPMPQINSINRQSILPVISTADSINLPAVDVPTILSSSAPCKSSAFEETSNQPLFISLPQTTATALPSTSMITCSPQLCPSHLPSPTLPSYPTIPSPLYMEAPVFKVSSSKKDSDIEKLIELMLLAEILNNDESFDWDDLDTLLAFLSVS